MTTFLIHYRRDCGDAGPSNPLACPAATGTAVCNTPCPEAGLGCNDAGLVWGCSI